MTRKMLGLWALVLFLGLLGVGTINNQLRINQANERLAMQARAGQLNLDRTCKLVPISKKMYAWALLNSEESKFTPEDYDLVVSSAAQICPAPKPTP